MKRFFQVFLSEKVISKNFSKYILVLIVIIVALTVISIRSQDRVLKQNFNYNIKFVTNLFGQSISDSVATSDYTFIQTIIDNLLDSQPDIIYAALLSSDNKVILSSLDNYSGYYNEKLNESYLKLDQESGQTFVKTTENKPIKEILKQEKENILSKIQTIKTKHPCFKKCETNEDIKQELAKLNLEIEINESNIIKLKEDLNIDSISNKKIQDLEKKVLTLHSHIDDLQVIMNLTQQLQKVNDNLEKLPNDNNIYEVYSPVGHSLGYINIGYSPIRIEKASKELYFNSFFLSFLFILISIIVSTKLLSMRHNLEEAVKTRTEELNKTLKKIERTNIVLEEALKHKSKFISTMSHELRTPLNAIIGYTQAMKLGYYGDVNETQSDCINIINDSGEHLLELINDILDLAKLDLGTASISQDKFCLNECLESIVSMLSTQFMAKRILFEFHNLDQDIYIHADKRRFKQIIINLLSNALKFTRPNGKVSLELELTTDDYVFISVIDNGIGIRKEETSKIFKEFYQVEQVKEEAIGGTGIGLALSKRLVEMHNGIIGVNSELGKGSTFWIKLPVEY